MSANIDKMMYVKETPWHGLGTKLDNPATSAEAIIAAGLDWTVSPIDIFYNSEKGPEAIATHVAIQRNDNKCILGVVGKERYTPVQNKEAFSFFDAVVGEKAAMYHTAGSLGIGERIWLLAKLPGGIVVLKDDVIDKYLLLANSHDGSLRLTMMFTPIRVVCQNTLNLAISSDETRVRLKHTPKIGLRIDQVRDALGIANKRYDLFGQLSSKLVTTQLDQQGWVNYRNNVMGVQDAKEIPTRTKHMLETLSQLFETGKGTDIKGVRGTAWAGFNAFAEYVDFNKGRRDTGDVQANRANDLLFGAGALLKQRAWDSALTLAR